MTVSVCCLEYRQTVAGLAGREVKIDICLLRSTFRLEGSHYFGRGFVFSQYAQSDAGAVVLIAVAFALGPTAVEAWTMLDQQYQTQASNHSQVGFSSPHFFFLRRHVIQPVLVRKDGFLFRGRSPLVEIPVSSRRLWGCDPFCHVRSP